MIRTDQPADVNEHMAARVENLLFPKPLMPSVCCPPKLMTWEQAKAWAESLNINGQHWRLPTIEELRCGGGR